MKTVNAASNAINGYYTTLWQNGALVKSAYSPTSFTFKNGQTYQLSLADYGGYAFDHWNDGSTIRQMTVTLGVHDTYSALQDNANKGDANHKISGA